MNNLPSPKRAILFLSKAVLVVLTCALCGYFARVWQANSEDSRYLPVGLILLLLAWTMHLRFRGQEEKSWATLMVGSSSIPILTFLTAITYEWGIFILIVFGSVGIGLVYFGLCAARKLSWVRMLVAVVIQSFITFAIVALMRIPSF